MEYPVLVLLGYSVGLLISAIMKRVPRLQRSRWVMILALLFTLYFSVVFFYFFRTQVVRDELPALFFMLSFVVASYVNIYQRGKAYF